MGRLSGCQAFGQRTHCVADGSNLACSVLKILAQRSIPGSITLSGDGFRVMQTIIPHLKTYFGFMVKI